MTTALLVSAAVAFGFFLGRRSASKPPLEEGSATASSSGNLVFSDKALRQIRNSRR